jgi:hypothetical protein
MARLLDWPRGLAVTRMRPLTGPRSIGSGSSQSLSGFSQTYASPFGYWRFQVDVQPMERRLARSVTSFITALHGGANAVRMPLFDPHGLSWSEAGVNVSGAFEGTIAVNWSNGQPHAEGRPFDASRPTVALASPAAKGASVVTLANTHWGHSPHLMGFIGFGPFYFGLHVITQALGGGQYRIWPPLRKSLGAGAFATLDPVIVMRLEGEGSAAIEYQDVVTDGASFTFLEVPDDQVRAWFSEA